jgi:hypothetical protein
LSTYTIVNAPIINSLLIFEKDFDSFFAPATYEHTGYANDGFWYNQGFVNTGRVASWSSETPGSFRGENPSFPSSVLAVLGASSLILFDITENTPALWLTSLLGDSLALASNINQQVGVGYTPSDLSWANGLLSVNYVPDPGASLKTTITVTFDFTRDQVYLDSYPVAP